MFKYTPTDSTAVAPLYQDLQAMFPYIEHWRVEGDTIIAEWEYMDQEVMLPIYNFVSGWISCWKRHMH